MAHIEFLDETLRDGQQSLWGMRMQAGMALPVTPMLDRTGFRVIDLTGSSMFECLIKYCRENPWEGLDLLVQAIRYGEQPEVVTLPELIRIMAADEGGGGDAEAISAHVAVLRASLARATQAHERTPLQARLGRLGDGVAVVRIGATTEIEMKEKRARAENALRAVRAAQESGTVPGGGVALLRIQPSLARVKTDDADEKIGVDIVLRALPTPIRQIADNCGVDGSVIADEVAEKPTNTGYDANNGKYVDMFKAGIIDPLKVVRTALENAASIAALMLTTETLVTDLDADDKKRRRVEGSVR